MCAGSRTLRPPQFAEVHRALADFNDLPDGRLRQSH